MKAARAWSALCCVLSLATSAMLRLLSGRLPPGEFFGTFLLAQKACLKFLFPNSSLIDCSAFGLLARGRQSPQCDLI